MAWRLLLEYAISIAILQIMDFQIRLSKPEESEKILELQANSLRSLSPSYTSTQIESLVRSQALARLDKDEIGIVAEYQNNIVGFASFLVKSSLITAMYVHPDFIRQGIGTQLLDTVQEIAIDKGNKVARVISSLDAVKFYQAAGYKIIRKSGFYSEEKKWIPCIILQNELVSISNTQRIYIYVDLLISWLKSIRLIIFFIIISTLIAARFPPIIILLVVIFLLLWKPFPPA